MYLYGANFCIRICRPQNQVRKEELVCRLIYKEKRLYIRKVGVGNRKERGEGGDNRNGSR